MGPYYNTRRCKKGGKKDATFSDIYFSVFFFIFIIFIIGPHSKRKMNVNSSLYVFPFFRFSVFFVFRSSSFKTKQTHVNFSSFESLIRPLSHQHHSAIYTFYNHEFPLLRINKKKKNKIKRIITTATH